MVSRLSLRCSDILMALSNCLQSIVDSFNSSTITNIHKTGGKANRYCMCELFFQFNRVKGELADDNGNDLYSRPSCLLCAMVLLVSSGKTIATSSVSSSYLTLLPLPLVNERVSAQWWDRIVREGVLYIWRQQFSLPFHCLSAPFYGGKDILYKTITWLCRRWTSSWGLLIRSCWIIVYANHNNMMQIETTDEKRSGRRECSLNSLDSIMTVNLTQSVWIVTQTCVWEKD